MINPRLPMFFMAALGTILAGAADFIAAPDRSVLKAGVMTLTDWTGLGFSQPVALSFVFGGLLVTACLAMRLFRPISWKGAFASGFMLFALVVMVSP